MEKEEFLKMGEYGRDMELCFYREDDDDPCFDFGGCDECPYYIKNRKE